MTVDAMATHANNGHDIDKIRVAMSFVFFWKIHLCLWGKEVQVPSTGSKFYQCLINGRNIR